MRTLPVMGLTVLLMLMLVLASSARAEPLLRAARHIYGSFDASAAVIADLDEDGIPDVASGDPAASQIRLFKGAGDGTLVAVSTQPGVSATALAAGDLNDDDHVDLVATSGGVTRVLLGHGDFTFAAPVAYGSSDGSSYGTQALTIADVTGDLIPDVVAGDTTGAVHVWPGAGDGPLLDPITLPAPGAGVIDLVVAADLDGNGDLDVIAAGDSIYVFLGSGGGAFAAPQVYQATGAVAVGLIDGDAVLDLVSGPDWRHGNSDGTFAASSPIGGAVSGDDPVVADLDEDGHGDLLTVQYDSIQEQYLAFYHGDGSGGFAAPVRQRTTTYPGLPAPGDLNGDGHVDLVVPSSSLYPLEVYVGNGDGTFGDARNTDTPGDPVQVMVAEVTGDGDADVLALCQSASTLRIFPGQGDGTLGSPADLPIAPNVRRFALGDVDADGRPDLVTADGAANDVSVYPGLPGGGFGIAAAHPLGTTALDVAVADMNGDGVGDVVALGGNGSVSIFPGQNGGPLGAASSYGSLVTGWLGRVFVGHVNADTLPDVAVFGNSGWAWAIFPGLPGGGLGAPAILSSGLSTNFSADGAAGDVNGDGALDLVASDNESILSVLLCDGDGTFTAAPLQGGAAVMRRVDALALGDIDDDGHADLFTGNYDLNAGAVALGDGSGAFLLEQGYGSGGRAGDVALGDLNGDGRLDAVLANTYPPSVTVLMNAAEPTVSVGPSGVAGAVLSFARVWPVPAHGGALSAAIVLPARAEARLELVDVTGRRVAARRLGVLEAGARTVALDLPATLRPGVYWLRLAAGGRTVAARVAIVR